MTREYRVVTSHAAIGWGPGGSLNFKKGREWTDVCRIRMVGGIWGEGQVWRNARDACPRTDLLKYRNGTANIAGTDRVQWWWKRERLVYGTDSEIIATAAQLWAST